MVVKRSVRIAERVREEISLAVGRDLSDPRLRHVLVTDVRVPDDLSFARVFIRLATGGDDADRRENAVKALGAASGMLRRRLSAALGLRRAPNLEFRFDEGQEARDRIEQVLEEIRKERPDDT